jgi:pimeloyl-ACP methyl ester carboxylesterase
MVLCDGLGCDGFAWKYLLPRLKAQHRVIRWHYRGHGRSTVPAERTRVGMAYTCDDLAAVLEATGVKEAVVFGHSMGAQVALEFHRGHPELVRGLVLVCGSYGNPLDTFHDDTLLKTAFPAIRSVVERFPSLSAKVINAITTSEIALQVALRFEVNGELLRRADLIPYFDHLGKMDPVVFVRTLDALAEHTAWDHLPSVNVPTLVIGGETDRFTPLWLSRRMADAIPGSEFMIVPQGSHTATLEQPELVWHRIERFLRERVLRPSEPGLKPEPSRPPAKANGKARPKPKKAAKRRPSRPKVPPRP